MGLGAAGAHEKSRDITGRMGYTAVPPIDREMCIRYKRMDTRELLVNQQNIHQTRRFDTISTLNQDILGDIGMHSPFPSMEKLSMEIVA